ncbi:hypothetical protein [Thiorhodococcus minor]|uniref:Uncharacterized protein n=1 Tax=Thiorhodococcus minor TaxID=57489 RepID=A0A6M0JS72_9GAMM|nr:hypothetical protein [Thiorhodococcus minor]NEV60372.1 hypothetical protein [Thiorhodococcus minor]
MSLEAPALLSFEIFEDGEPTGVTAGFALEGLLAALGRFRDVSHAARHFWPDQSSRFAEVYVRPVLASVLPLLTQRLANDRDLVNRILQAETSPWYQVGQHDDHPADATALFDFFCNFRRFVGKASMLDEVNEITQPASHMISTAWLSKALPLKEEMPRADRRMLTMALRSYLSAEYLFPWLPERDDNVTSIYYPRLFEAAEILEPPMPHTSGDILDQQLDELDVDHESAETIRRIFRRISNVIGEVGDFDEVVRGITSEGGQWGRDSMVGSNGPINIIPAPDHNASCRQVLVAFARGKKPRYGLKAVMRQVREQLIRCGDSACRWDEPTRIVILFTDIWDKTIFSESLGDIQAHRQTRSMRKIIIGALVNGSQVTPQKI